LTKYRPSHIITHSAYLKVVTMLKSEILLPCASFFSNGQLWFGVVALAMQLSVVYWPAAVRWAWRAQEQSGVEQLLAEFSTAYHVPADPYAAPAKTFRPTI
jgi:hypothetical protein